MITTSKLVLILVFVSVVCLTLAIVEVFHARKKWRRLHERVKPMYTEKTGVSDSYMNRLKRRVNRSDYGKEVDLALKGADLKLTAFDWLLIQIGVFAVAALLLRLLASLVFPFDLLIAWVILSIGSRNFLRSRQNKLSQLLNKQLPELCRMLSSCIRAGLSLQQGFEMIAKELRAPAGPIFRGMSSEVKMGTSMETVLEKLEERVKSKDIAIFVQTVIVQRKAGGNISQAMDHLAKTLDERSRINGEIRTQTAETKFVAVALLLMPIFLVLMFNMMFDGFIMPIFTIPGLILLLVVAVMMAAGFYLISKVTNVKV